VILEWDHVLLRMSGESEVTRGVRELLEIGYEMYSESLGGGAIGGERIDHKGYLAPNQELTQGTDYEFRWPGGRCVSPS